MRRLMDLLVISLVFCVASCGLGSGLAPTIFNVLNFGAIGDGRSDDSNAFVKAWKALCGATGAGGTPILSIPQGKTFLVRPLNFPGPCKSSSVHIQVLGSIVAPNAMNAWTNCTTGSWLSFSDVGNLIMNGTGIINGQGALWWSRMTSDVKLQSTLPTALRLNNCNKLQLSGLNHLNSPKNHISISNCRGATISNLHINAPPNSPNTDGIDISTSTQINIHDCTIKTGDDCIAINGGSSHVNITRVSCGPGHGISVGSLGRNGANEIVEEVHVQNCSFFGSQNGVRIKTWQGGSGFARKITFEQITLVAVQHSIVIDQFYCNGVHNCTNTGKAQAVKVSDVTYRGVHGTSATNQAITLNCDKLIGCTNIVMEEINITSSFAGKRVFATCNNAQGTQHSTAPNVPCLSKISMFP